MIIDSHVHLSMSDNKLRPILDACDKLGVEKVCLLAPHKEMLPALSEAPDRVVPVVIVEMDREHSSFIHFLVDKGAKGLKFTRPQRPYNHKAYHGFYATAEEYGLPILFHTGIVSGRTPRSVNDHMRPVLLDHVARTFPDLKIVMAHLGNPWWDEAAMAARHNRNIYFDLSGSSMKVRAPKFFRSILWWDKPDHPYQGDGGKGPFDKLLFGTDVAPEWMHDVHADYGRLMDGMGVPEEYRAKIMGATAAEIYGVC